LRLVVPVIALMAVAGMGISTSAQPRTAADPSGDVAGIDPGQELTGLAASVLTHPRAVRGTDGRLHIAYELVLTGMTALAVDVERVEVRDAKTQRVLLSTVQQPSDGDTSRAPPAGCSAPAPSRPRIWRPRR
jgi:hypothetical protein